MAKSYKLKDENYLDSSGIIYKNEKKDLETILDNYNIGTTREVTVINSYVRLFSVNLTANYKDCSIFFTLTDTQSGDYSQFVDLLIRHGATSASILVHNFKTLPFRGDVTTKLVAVVVDSKNIEVYCKMEKSQSPTINILSIAKLSNGDNYGKLTIDCETVVSTLPSGTQTFVSNIT